MRPGTTAWTCPECGHENGSAAMVDLADTPEPEHEPQRAPVQPRHAAPPPGPKATSGPPTRARLATIAVIGIAAVLIVAFALSAFGGEGGGAATTTTSTSSPTPAPSSSLTVTQTLCLHLRDLQLVRVDNYTRLAAELANDQAAIQASGDAKLAAKVGTMRTAVLAYRDALASQGDTSQVSRQIGDALGALPCGQTGG
jgi:hypothetical protein